MKQSKFNFLLVILLIALVANAVFLNVKMKDIEASITQLNEDEQTLKNLEKLSP